MGSLQRDRAPGAARGPHRHAYRHAAEAIGKFDQKVPAESVARDPLGSGSIRLREKVRTSQIERNSDLLLELCLLSNFQTRQCGAEGHCSMARSSTDLVIRLLVLAPIG